MMSAEHTLDQSQRVMHDECRAHFGPEPKGDARDTSREQTRSTVHTWTGAIEWCASARSEPAMERRTHLDRSQRVKRDECRARLDQSQRVMHEVPAESKRGAQNTLGPEPESGARNEWSRDRNL